MTMKGWIKVWPRILADSEKVSQLHPAQRYWYIMLIGAAYNDFLPGLLVDDKGKPLSLRTLAHDFRTQHQQIERSISACVEADLIRRYDLDGMEVLAVGKYATHQADYKKRGTDLDTVVDAFLSKSGCDMAASASSRKKKASTAPDEKHPEKLQETLAEMLDFIGYRRMKNIQKSTDNSEITVEKDVGRPEARGQRKEARGQSADGEREFDTSFHGGGSPIASQEKASAHHRVDEGDEMERRRQQVKNWDNDR